VVWVGGRETLVTAAAAAAVAVMGVTTVTPSTYTIIQKKIGMRDEKEQSGVHYLISPSFTSSFSSPSSFLSTSQPCKVGRWGVDVAVFVFHADHFTKRD